MLRSLGQDAALLDGGFDAWTGLVETGAVEFAAVVRHPIPWGADALADADEVAAHIDAGGVVVDSRAVERFRGETEPIDAVARHIPGAVDLPFADNLVDGRFRPTAALRERFADVAADPNAIVYCGSGVTACHNALALEHATGMRPRVYVGSWSGWTTEAGRAIATGDA